VDSENTSGDLRETGPQPNSLLGEIGPKLSTLVPDQSSYWLQSADLALNLLSIGDFCNAQVIHRPKIAATRQSNRHSSFDTGDTAVTLTGARSIRGRREAPGVGGRKSGKSVRSGHP
jgi:hypothetical protein